MKILSKLFFSLENLMNTFFSTITEFVIECSFLFFEVEIFATEKITLNPHFFFFFFYQIYKAPSATTSTHCKFPTKNRGSIFGLLIRFSSFTTRQEQ
jgi:hypothetical protein